MIQRADARPTLATSTRKARPLGWLIGDDSQEAIRQLGARHVDLAAVDAVLRTAQLEKKKEGRVKLIVARDRPTFEARPKVRKRLVADLERVLEFYRRHVNDYHVDRTYELAEELHTRLTGGMTPGGDPFWMPGMMRPLRKPTRGPWQLKWLHDARQALTALKVPTGLATVLLRAARLISPLKKQ